MYSDRNLFLMTQSTIYVSVTEASFMISVIISTLKHLCFLFPFIRVKCTAGTDLVSFQSMSLLFLCRNSVLLCVTQHKELHHACLQQNQHTAATHSLQCWELSMWLGLIVSGVEKTVKLLASKGEVHFKCVSISHIATAAPIASFRIHSVCLRLG